MKQISKALVVIGFMAAIISMVGCGKTPEPPVAEVHPVVDTLHGKEIVDNYRWLENGEDSTVQEWVNAEDTYCRSILGEYKKRDYLKNRIDELMKIGYVGLDAIRGDKYFYSRRDDGQDQAVHLVKQGLDGEPRTLIDPNKLSADGTVALDYKYLSPDGSLMAYGLSSLGTENSTLYLMDVESGSKLTDSIPYALSASVSWLEDNSGFYYCRYPAPGSVPDGDEVYYRKIYFHKIGDNYEKDILIFGEGRDKTEWNGAQVSPDMRYLIVSTWQGWSKSELFIKSRMGKDSFKTITDGSETISIPYPSKDGLFLLTNEDAPKYKVMFASYKRPEYKNWKTIIPESDAIMVGLGVTKDYIVVNMLENAYSRLAVYDHDGKFIRDIKLPVIGSIFTQEEYEFAADLNTNQILFGFSSFFVPPRILHYDIETDKLSIVDEIKTDLDLDKFEAKQEWYESKDGTPVSMFIISKKGLKLDGNNPTLVYSYGGFNTNETPYFSRTRTMFLDDGGVYVVPNLRGGGEYGEDWHRAGMLENKQNTFDDLIACCEWLIEHKYTRPEKLLISGGSNGGLTTGAVMVQRPDLFKAVISSRPLLDMLRYQKFLIGSLWIPEYGSADNPDQFEYLLKYSPYHNVKKGTAYPAVLFLSADHDSRVDPCHVYKMTALMQASTSSDNPILMRVQRKTGHGQGTPVSLIIEELVDEYSFIYWQLGM